MGWQLKWGSHLKAFEARARATGVKPAPLVTRPRLAITDAPFIEAFFTISSTRTFGFSAPNPIQIAEVAAYCSVLGIASQPERAKYLRLIQMLDQVYLADWREKHPSKKPGAGGKNNNKS